MIPKSRIAAFLMSAALMASLNVNAESIEVQKFKYAGPYPVSVPWMADSVNVKAEKYSMDGVLDSPLNLSVPNPSKDRICASQWRSGCLASQFIYIYQYLSY